MERDDIIKYFENNVNTDADYLLICTLDSKNFFWDIIPKEPHLTTIDEAIKYCFKQRYNIVYIYDLYSPFEDALIKTVMRDSSHLLI